ncbi:MAG: hypothetical protein P8Y81_09425 [Ignavibacteriaceae bacterium]
MYKTLKTILITNRNKLTIRNVKYHSVGTNLNITNARRIAISTIEP